MRPHARSNPGVSRIPASFRLIVFHSTRAYSPRWLHRRLWQQQSGKCDPAAERRVSHTSASSVLSLDSRLHSNTACASDHASLPRSKRKRDLCSSSRCPRPGMRMRTARPRSSFPFFRYSLSSNTVLDGFTVEVERWSALRRRQVRWILCHVPKILTEEAGVVHACERERARTFEIYHQRTHQADQFKNVM